MASLEQILNGDAAPPQHFVEALGALAMWAMAEPGRTFKVAEVVGRSHINPAVSVTLTEAERTPRRAIIELTTELQPHDVEALLDLVTP